MVTDFDVTVTDVEGRIYGAYVDGKAPLSGGGGRYVGRVWHARDGWVAAPPATGGTGDSRAAEVARGVRGFRTRLAAVEYLADKR